MKNDTPSPPSHRDFFDFLDQSPTVFHTAKTLSARLTQAGFVTLTEGESWRLEAGGSYLVRRGETGVIAFRLGKGPLAEQGFLIACAHTDSPGLKIKPLSQSRQNGSLRIGVELYGSPIQSTWLDRELSIAGQVIAQTEQGITRLLVDLEHPVAVIPNLAIHYNREVNKGFSYDPQTQLSGLLGLNDPQSTMESLIAQKLQIAPESIIDTDLFFYSTQKACTVGADHGRYTSGRIDNLAGCHSILSALTDASAETQGTAMGVFFDAEEIGSTSLAGADSGFLSDIMERIIKVTGGSDEDFFRAKSRSFLVSVDGAHGVHPNFSDRHDPHYAPELGGGPVIKLAASHRYATTAQSAADFENLCKRAAVKPQRFIMRSDLVPGSTVGPMTSAASGIPAADVGEPLWAMHSVRETADLRDHQRMIAVLTEFFAHGLKKG